ncbi:MAG TPA: metalloregulator ArsR/SmtB family transcription factor [Anaeromyxobacteraceae bacterium]|nr:metalloregulator ArsR/SmtB family transcription factor [Anaeromyxobacteraceae bacterium]
MRSTTHSRRLAVAHYDEVARIGKALSSPVRLRLLDLLRQGSRNVEELAAAADETVANSSRHLQVMRSARLVRAERDGRHVRYALADEAVSRAFGMLRGVAETLLPEMELLRRELGALEDGERDRLLARIEAGEVSLVDVRPSPEFEAGHLPRARSIPLEELPRRTAELAGEREVVVYCRGPYCPMAAEAVELLAAAGIPARHLDLGVPDLNPSLAVVPPRTS